jgi:hypothetical protein
MDKVKKRNKHIRGHTAHGSMYREVVVTKAWRILKLRMQERPPVWRVAAFSESRQGLVLQVGVGRGANDSSA